ncbi:MAG: hypothetical protein JW763_05715 [candidate division Zixibacteria bacterium]|nr:hypothetical protein [candidate division Zixibacteria bacterium]
MTDKDKHQLSLGFGSAPEGEPPPVEELTTSDGEELTWVCHPAKRNRLVTGAVVLLIAAIVVSVYFLTYSALFTVLSFLIMTGSLAAFFFPTRYHLTESEIIVKTTTQKLHKTWSQYRTYYPDKNGVLLSPFARPSRLENFRGLYLRYDANREEVVTFVKRRIGQETSTKDEEA